MKNPEENEYFLGKFIRCFSVYSNSKLIFDTSITTEEGNMLSIYGIRTLTIIWIVMNHGVLYTADYYYNRTAAYFISDHLILQAFSNSSFSVDSFFCISGFLLGYGFLELEKQKARAGIQDTPTKKILFILVGIIDRIFRLLPAYLAAMGFAYTTSAMRYRQTAFWTSERNDITCAAYWWRNSLFINNLFSKEDICMNWSWYLSSDMQNFILCIILLVLATSYLKTVIFAFISIFVLANIYTAYAAYSIGFVPFIDNMWSYYEVVYVRPWTRFGPNLIGLAGGCILQYYKRKLPFSKITISIFWLAGLSAGMTMMFGFADKDMSLLSSAMYMGLGRSVWAFSVMWLLLACLSGNAGFINSILSHPVWIPLGRLSYCVYLINPMVIKTFGSYTDSTWEVGIQTAMVNGIGYTVLSFIIAFAFSLVFESPFFKLRKLFLGDIKQNISSKVSTEIKKNS